MLPDNDFIVLMVCDCLNLVNAKINYYRVRSSHSSPLQLYPSTLSRPRSRSLQGRHAGACLLAICQPNSAVRGSSSPTTIPKQRCQVKSSHGERRWSACLERQGQTAQQPVLHRPIHRSGGVHAAMKVALLLAAAAAVCLIRPARARLGGECRPAGSAAGATDGLFLIRNQADLDAVAAGCTVSAMRKGKGAC